MSNGGTTTDKRDKYGMLPEDWKRQDALTDEEIAARALSDPDNPPLTPEQLEAMGRPRPLSKVIRNQLRMTRQLFSENYGIPIETLRAWERHEAEPSPAEIAYLHLIEREPDRAKLIMTEQT